MGWWQKLLGKSSEPKSSDRASTSPARRDADVRWMSPDEPGNPFGVPLLNLMSNLQLISTTQDPALASRAISWRAGQQDRLNWDVDGESIDCSLEYELEAPLPDGMLFLPQAMEDKWVIAFKSGRIAGARSWSGETQWVADARHIACALGHLEAAKTLVELGAHMHATSKTGTALDIARSENKPDVVTWLERLR